MNKVKHPFWVIVHKEIADHVHSLRFIILISIIVLTCMIPVFHDPLKSGFLFHPPMDWDPRNRSLPG